ncbi:hypothetical protein ACIOGT_36220 [Streptomyces microflavus]|uniref:hypothetical protein n=1 Tax=Streptomyces microflavus TaxID=1919 RepID=UPI00380C8E5F
MSFTWRYVVRPNGSLSRVGNLNGSLDNVSDEELARLERDEDEQPERPCSRCGTELLLHWHGPLMTGVWMELCPPGSTPRWWSKARRYGPPRHADRRTDPLRPSVDGPGAPGHRPMLRHMPVSPGETTPWAEGQTDRMSPLVGTRVLGTFGAHLFVLRGGTGA